MKKYSRVFKYIRRYKSEALLYILFIVLSIVFSLISLGMLFPFLELIFSPKSNGAHAVTAFAKSTNPVITYVRTFLENSIDTRGPVGTLAIICLLIIITTLLKNLFLYLAYYILNPLKNKIVNQLRSELYEKILHLPIGYFTEKKKGDVISRMTNDVGEVEASVIGTLEGWVRDPLNIIITLIMLFIWSYQLTLFVLL